MPFCRVAPVLAALVLAAPVLAEAQAARNYTPADVRFVQGMIQHHGQALDMTALVSGRSKSSDLSRLGERITVSQRDEIAMMSSWLRARGEATTPAELHEGHVMPGMLSVPQIDSLRAARGD